MLKTGVMWGLIFVSWVALPSCWERSCTDIGCTGLTVSIRPAASAWRPGEYQLELTLDDGTRTCGFVMPDDLSGGHSSKKLDCGSRVVSQLGEQELFVTFSRDPERLGLRLLRDGDVVVSSDGAPPYQKFEPNGPDCGVCRQANMKFTAEN